MERERITERVSKIENRIVERAAFEEACSNRVEEMRVDIEALGERLREVERAVLVIQTRLAMLTTLAGLVGALVGSVLGKFLEHLISKGS